MKVSTLAKFTLPLITAGINFKVCYDKKRQEADMYLRNGNSYGHDRVEKEIYFECIPTSIVIYLGSLALVLISYSVISNLEYGQKRIRKKSRSRRHRSAR